MVGIQQWLADARNGDHQAWEKLHRLGHARLPIARAGRCNSKEVNGRSDVYTLDVILFRLPASRLPPVADLPCPSLSRSLAEMASAWWRGNSLEYPVTGRSTLW
jgi:hypothetical protein